VHECSGQHNYGNGCGGGGNDDKRSFHIPSHTAHPGKSCKAAWGID
jgi:hypothetical protein